MRLCSLFSRPQDKKPPTRLLLIRSWWQVPRRFWRDSPSGPKGGQKCSWRRQSHPAGPLQAARLSAEALRFSDATTGDGNLAQVAQDKLVSDQGPNLLEDVDMARAPERRRVLSGKKLTPRRVAAVSTGCSKEYDQLRFATGIHSTSHVSDRSSPTTRKSTQRTRPLSLILTWETPGNATRPFGLTDLPQRRPSATAAKLLLSGERAVAERGRNGRPQTGRMLGPKRLSDRRRKGDRGRLTEGITKAETRSAKRSATGFSPLVTSYAIQFLDRR